MGNIFDKSSTDDWELKLKTIDAEIAELEKRKCRMITYEKNARNMSLGLSLLCLSIAFILVILGYYFYALGLVCCALVFFGICICMSSICNKFAEHDEEKLCKCHATKKKLTAEIKNKVSYNETVSLLKGHDRQIDKDTSVFINLEKLIY